MNDERNEEAGNDAPPPDAAGEPRGEPKVIKRYTNRKLYDTEESRYVTLDEIAQMIKGGAEVKIIDNRTKEDLTSVTLAQIIFEEEKKTSKMSLDTLRGLIRHGGEVAQRFVEGRVEAVRAGVEQRVQNLLTRGQDTRERALELVQASQEAMVSLQRKVDERVRATVDGMSNLGEVRRQLEEIGRRIEELEKRLDEMGKDEP
jgi:polyhydroxyalkanoate synthesis repressor PhaR